MAVFIERYEPDGSPMEMFYAEQCKKAGVPFCITKVVGKPKEKAKQRSGVIVGHFGQSKQRETTKPTGGWDLR